MIRSRHHASAPAFSEHRRVVRFAWGHRGREEAVVEDVVGVRANAVVHEDVVNEQAVVSAP